MKLAIIGGSGLKDYKKDGILFLQRHGKGVSPHKIDHQKNIRFLKDKGVDRIIGVCSVGSLKDEIKPGSIVVPHDFINFFSIVTIFDEQAKHIVVRISEDVRGIILNSAKNVGASLFDKGIYFQTSGPRFETEAEINMIKNFADIVGMTMASEATIACELGIEYAAVCLVDNYANGIGKQLTEEDWKKGQKESHDKIIRLFDNFKM